MHILCGRVTRHRLPGCFMFSPFSVITKVFLIISCWKVTQHKLQPIEDFLVFSWLLLFFYNNLCSSSVHRISGIFDPSDVAFLLGKNRCSQNRLEQDDDSSIMLQPSSSWSAPGYWEGPLALLHVPYNTTIILHYGLIMMGIKWRIYIVYY